MAEKLNLRTCKNEKCGVIFQPTVPRMVYHERKCFMEEWKRKQKSTNKPKFRCPECGKVSQLDFNPKSKMALYRWSCSCGFRPL